MAPKKKKPSCHHCKGLGLYPFCDYCFRSSDRTIQQISDIEARKKKSEDQMTWIERQHWKDIARHKYLQNCRDLKNMFRAYLRSRKLLVGSVELNAIITTIISDITKQIHEEIDLEDLVTFADVTNRFDVLLGEKEPDTEINTTDPEYLHNLKDSEKE